MSAYVMPSQCQQCVPVETHADHVTHYAHETECPNTRKEPKR